MKTNIDPNVKQTILTRSRRVYIILAAFVVYAIIALFWQIWPQYVLLRLVSRTESAVVDIRIVGSPRRIYHLNRQQSSHFLSRVLDTTSVDDGVRIATGQNVDVFLVDQSGHCVSRIWIHPTERTIGDTTLTELVEFASTGEAVRDATLPLERQLEPPIHRVYYR